jgi:hypothetical protein
MENPKEAKRGLDESLKAYPELADKVREIVGELEQIVARGGSLDEAEERVVPLVRKFGAEVLAARARRIAGEAPAPSGVRVGRDAKKKFAG